MTIQKIKNKLGKLNEVTPDQRIDLHEMIIELEDEISGVREMLHDLPDSEPEKGIQNQRDAFVDKLIEESEQTKVVKKLKK